MSPLERLKGFQKNRIKRQVEEIAFPITIELIDSIYTQEGGPDYSYDVGKKPRGLSGFEYTDRLAEHITAGLARVGLENAVSYDPEETRLASTEIVATSEFDWRNDLKENLTIVFTST
jgi:hypothetical protein